MEKILILVISPGFFNIYNIYVTARKSKNTAVRYFTSRKNVFSPFECNNNHVSFTVEQMNQALLKK